MRRQVLVSIILCVTACYLGWPQAAGAVEWINCNDPYYRTLDLAPVGAGPLELAKVTCQRVQADFQQIAMVSPDGGSIMYLQGGGDYTAERKVLYTARLDARDEPLAHLESFGRRTNEPHRGREPFEPTLELGGLALLDVAKIDRAGEIANGRFELA